MGIADFMKRFTGSFSGSTRKEVKQERGKLNPFSARGFDAANMDRLTADWRSWDNMSMDGNLRMSLNLIRNRARDLAVNNQVARRYLNMLLYNVIGPEGFNMQVRGKRNGQLLQQINDQIENAFWDWAGKKTASVNGKHSFREICEIVLRNVALDGEVFVRKVRGYNGQPINKYGFAIDFIQPEAVDERMNEWRKDTFVALGVELDAVTRRPVRYWVNVYDPTVEALNHLARTKQIPVDADEIIHVYDPDKSNQTRGYSWLATSMLALRQLHKYQEYALINARVAASKVAFITKTETATEYTGTHTDSTGQMMQSIEPGSFPVLEPGQGIQAFTPQYPSEQYAGFVKANLRAVAGGLNVSYNTLCNDLEGVTYSSIRAGLLDERDYWRRVQNWFMESFLRPVFEAWLESAVLTGAVKISMSDLELFNHPVWNARRWSWVDPLKDVEANRIAVEQGFKTRTEVIAETGKDVYEVFEQLKFEQELAEQYGLTFGMNKGFNPAADAE